MWNEDRKQILPYSRNYKRGGGIGLKKDNVLFTNTQSNTNLIPLLIFWKEKKREEDYSRIV